MPVECPAGGTYRNPVGCLSAHRACSSAGASGAAGAEARAGTRDWCSLGWESGVFGWSSTGTAVLAPMVLSYICAPTLASVITVLSVPATRADRHGTWPCANRTA